jgi:hypothetical protein
VLVGGRSPTSCSNIAIIALMIVVGYHASASAAGVVDAIAAIAVVAALRLALSWIASGADREGRRSGAGSGFVDLPARVRELGVRSGVSMPTGCGRSPRSARSR